MEQYLELLKDIKKNGNIRKDRTGTGTISVFGHMTRYDLRKGFPLMTTKRMPFKAIWHELKWFLNGDTNIKYLVDRNVKIWNDDAYKFFVRNNPGTSLTQDEYIERIRTDGEFAKRHGGLGPIYGKQWRDRGGIDQIRESIRLIKTDSSSRRIVVDAWNPEEQQDVALPPCHNWFQFYVEGGRLSCMFSMRSNDCFLGAPFNIASYALLTHKIAHVCGIEVGELIHVSGDTHLYLDHLDAVEEQLSRKPRSLPVLSIQGEVKDINDFEFENFKLTGYDPFPAIYAPQSS